MLKKLQAYGFKLFVDGKISDDGTINCGPALSALVPPPEWYDYLTAYYTRPGATVDSMPNRGCGHVGIRDSKGRCIVCDLRRAELQRELMAVRDREEEIKREIRSLGRADPDTIAPSRADALRTGARWYMPAEPCKYCGQTAPRYVANGRCRSCG